MASTYTRNSETIKAEIDEMFDADAVEPDKLEFLEADLALALCQEQGHVYRLNAEEKYAWCIRCQVEWFLDDDTAQTNWDSPLPAPLPSDLLISPAH